MRKKIGRYVIEDKLGQGGMGVVYKGYDPLLDRVVAIKLMTSELTRNEKLVKRFLREARISAKLDHPNIIKVYDLGIEGDNYYIVMEYIDGFTLRSYIAERGRIDLKESIDIFVQILSAMDYAHSRGVIHRDLKPENIMLTRDMTVKVMDFGLAFIKGEHSITSPGSIMGTLVYFSPEQARGEELDHRTDIYALGVILFELLTGKLPLLADNPAAMINKLLTQPPPSPKVYNPAIPDGLAEVVLKALSKDKEERFHSARDFMEAVLPYRGDSGYERKQPSTKVLREELKPEPPKPSSPLVGRKENGPILPGSRDTELEEPEIYEEWISKFSRLRDIISKERLNLKSPSVRRGTALSSGLEGVISKYGIPEESLGKVCKICGTVNLPNARYCKNCGAPLDLKEGIPVSSEMIEKAKKLYKAGRYKEVVELLLPALGGTDNKDVVYLVVRSYQKMKEYERALEILEAKLPRLKSKRLVEIAGDLAYELRQYEKAAEYYEKVFYKVGNPELLYKLAKATAKFDVKRAMHLFEKLLEADPSFHKAKRYLAELCIELGDLPRAVMLLKDYLQEYPSDSKAYLALAKAYKELGMIGELSELYMQVLGARVEDPQLLYQIAKFKLETGDKKEALELLRRASELAPDDLDILNEAYILSKALKDYKTSVELLERIIELNPNNPELFMELGDGYMELKEYQRAAQAFYKFLEIYPNDLVGLLKLGDALLKANSYSKALEVYLKAYELDSYNPKVLEKLSLVNHLMGKSDEAIRYLEKAVSLDPKNLDYIKGLAKILRDTGRLSDAARYLQMILDDKPDDPITNAMLGDIYAKQGLISSAIYYLKTAISKDYSLRWAEWLLIDLYLMRGDYDSALEELEILANLIEIHGERGDDLYKAWYKKCEILLRKGNRTEALRFAQNYLGKTRGLYHYALKAFILYVEGKPIEAIETLKEALPKYMGPDLLELIADYRVRSGEFVKALKYVERLLSDKEPKAFHFYLRGLINFQLNNFSQAFDDLLEAYKLGYRTADIVPLIVWLGLEVGKDKGQLLELSDDLSGDEPTILLLRYKLFRATGRSKEAEQEMIRLSKLYPELAKALNLQG